MPSGVITSTHFANSAKLKLKSKGNVDNKNMYTDLERKYASVRCNADSPYNLVNVNTTFKSWERYFGKSLNIWNYLQGWET